MKKLLFIILLCFLAVFVVIAMPMSPHPGDSLEMILTLSDDVVIENQTVSAPTFENVLHLDQYNYNEICLSANDEMIGITNDIFNSGLNADTAVVHIDFEMGTINLNTVEDITVYKTEFG